MNEATVWARAIYPLLLLAEQKSIQAWSEVTLQAKYKNFELLGIADGVLGKTVTGFIADIWTFLRAEIGEIDGDLPTMKVEYSREYVEKYDAETILKILKGIVSRYLAQN